MEITNFNRRKLRPGFFRRIIAGNILFYTAADRLLAPGPVPVRPVRPVLTVRSDRTAFEAGETIIGMPMIGLPVRTDLPAVTNETEPWAIAA
jgi:hypothetical protein